MSAFLGWLGGGPKKSVAPKNAILGLRTQIEILKRREKHLESTKEEQDNIAREFVRKKNPTGAKSALRRKGMIEKSLESTRSQVETLEAQIFSLEGANITKTTYEALESAGNAYKAIHSGLTVSKVDKAMDELHEQEEIGEEINQAIFRSSRNVVDESELDAELAELNAELAEKEQSELDRKMLDVGTVSTAHRLPIAPKEPAKAPVDDEEEELRRLQAEMAM